MKPIPYYHVDVFSSSPLSGNGLTVFTESADFSDRLMQRITQEMRQFESIFLQRTTEFSFIARVFTCEEELDFAGHPVLGAAGLAHDLYYPESSDCTWKFQLNSKTVEVSTTKEGDYYNARMNQGVAEFGQVLSQNETASLLQMMNLTPEDLYPGLLPCVVSTGLPYVLLPLQKNGLRASIRVNDITDTLAAFGAQFIGTLEIPTNTIRTWNNTGLSEDIATGSLAGPCAAFLVKNNFEKGNELFLLHQGANLDRPSEIFVEVKESNGMLGDVYVGGPVIRIGQGSLQHTIRSYSH